MRRSTIATAVLCLLALTSTSFAGNKSNNQKKSQKKPRNVQAFVQKMTNPAQMLRQPLLAGMSNDSDSSKKHKKHGKHGTHNRQDDNINNIIPVEVPTGPSTPQNRPGFVWVGDHWERARAQMTTSSTSASQSGQASASNPFAATRGVDGRHRDQGMSSAANNAGIPPAFLEMTNSPPPAMSKPTWDSGKLPAGVTVRPGSPNRADVTGSGWSPTIEIEGELNPAYDSDRDHRTGNPIPTYGSSLPWPFGP